MPKFIDEKTGVEVDTDGKDGGFVIKIGSKRKPLELSVAQSHGLAAQIAFAEEYVNLYARRPV